MYERISINPKIHHGVAYVKGTRIPVHLLVRMMANGDTIDDLLVEYPSLTREDILACLDYAASVSEEQVAPIEELLAGGARQPSSLKETSKPLSALYI